MTCKKGQFDVVELLDFRINLNAQHVNGITHMFVRLLGTLMYYTLHSTKYFIFLFCRIGIGKYQSTREMSYAENVQKCQKQSSNCRNHQHQDIRCSKCGHKLVPRNATFLNDLITPHAHSVRSLDLFGQKNVTVQEFVNPHNFHFHSIQVRCL